MCIDDESCGKPSSGCHRDSYWMHQTCSKRRFFVSFFQILVLILHLRTTFFSYRWKNMYTKKKVHLNYSIYFFTCRQLVFHHRLISLWICLVQKCSIYCLTKDNFFVVSLSDAYPFERVNRIQFGLSIREWQAEDFSVPIRPTSYKRLWTKQVLHRSYKKTMIYWREEIVSGTTYTVHLCIDNTAHCFRIF